MVQPDFHMIVTVCNVISDCSVLNVSRLIPDTTDTRTFQIRGDELYSVKFQSYVQACSQKHFPTKALF